MTKFAKFSDLCCICGSLQCIQSTDHQKITLNQLKSLISSKKIKNESLNILKQTIKEFYHEMKTHLNSIIQQDQKQLQIYLNKFYFPHLDQTKININLLCQITEGDYQRLPNKKIVKVKNNLNRNTLLNPQTEFEKCSELGSIKQQLKNYLQKFQTKSLTKKVQQFLPFNTAINKYLPNLTLKKSISDISIPEEVDEEAAKFYSWKNVSINKKSKSLYLNNKKITDLELIQQIPIISSFRNIKQFEIRNNLLTKLSCKLISSHLNFLKELDIRGNLIKDEGIIIIAKGITSLQKLMISETGVTDRAGESIVEGLPKLQMLWCEQNSISGQMAIRLAQKPKLRIMSLAKNHIPEEYGEKLKQLFNSKGYVVI